MVATWIIVVVVLSLLVGTMYVLSSPNITGMFGGEVGGYAEYFGDIEMFDSQGTDPDPEAYPPPDEDAYLIFSITPTSVNRGNPISLSVISSEPNAMVWGEFKNPYDGSWISSPSGTLSPTGGYFRIIFTDGVAGTLTARVRTNTQVSNEQKLQVNGIAVLSNKDVYNVGEKVKGMIMSTHQNTNAAVYMDGSHIGDVMLNQLGLGYAEATASGVGHHTIEARVGGDVSNVLTVEFR